MKRQRGLIWPGVTPLAIFICLSFGVTLLAQSSNITWPAGMPDKEKPEVLALIKLMGVDDPEKVSFGRVMILGDRYLLAESRPHVDGHERSWLRAYVFRSDWRGPDDAPPLEDRKPRVGRWIALGKAQRVVRWHIQDGGWLIDPSTDGNVPYDVAERIVLAVHRRTLVERRPDLLRRLRGLLLSPDLPSFDQYRAWQIRPDSMNQYRVTIWMTDSQGYELTVRDDGAHVELVDFGQFIV